jgi:hypothetical protein
MERKRKLTEADRSARQELIRNALRTRELAERAQAKLDAENPPTSPRPQFKNDRERLLYNAQHLRELAERAQAELDAQQN